MYSVRRTFNKTFNGFIKFVVIKKAKIVYSIINRLYVKNYISYENLIQNENGMIKMCDFLYSNQRIEISNVEEIFNSIYPDQLKKIYKFSGNWGTLFISNNLYNGFLPYENREFITIVVGGPVLYFQENSFIADDTSNEGTKAIFKKWLSGEIKWDEDLSGPFVVLIINKQTHEVVCVTDLMSFIPVFKYETSSVLSLSTHVDLLAKAYSLQRNIDMVSVADFIYKGTVTFPFTIYKNIYQINPSSTHIINTNSLMYISKYYWLPYEVNNYESIEQVAKIVKDGLNNYINKIVNYSNNIAQFLSGGEDSRLLSAMLKEHSRDGYIFLDQMNNEGKKAKKIADIYGVKFNLVTRDKLHYLKILTKAVNLMGGGNEHYHAHALELHKKCRLNEYDAVFGGLLSDALLKGARINKLRGTGTYPFIPQIKINLNPVDRIKDITWINNDILQSLIDRYNQHYKYISKFRKNSSSEWFELWPISMNRNIANFHTNRRLFRSYEPFTTKEIVKISAIIPQSWKLNRRLFHKVAKSYLKKSKWVLHSDGRLPYFSWKVNIFVSFIVIFSRILARKLGFFKGNQGSWGDWSFIINSDEWFNMIGKNSSSFEDIAGIFNDKNLNSFIHEDKLNPIEKINLLQVLYLLNNNRE